MRKRLINANELRAKLDEAYRKTSGTSFYENTLPGYRAGLLTAIGMLDEQQTVETKTIYTNGEIDAILLDSDPSYANYTMTELAKRVGIQLMEDRMLAFYQQEDPQTCQVKFKASVRALVPVPEEPDE